jgi:hypothetical protein
MHHIYARELYSASATHKEKDINATLFKGTLLILVAPEDLDQPQWP